ncbi:hypothetical protein [Rhodococcus qingshengii]|jgi:hypothetical protein|nr:hypothetical protein [Rhodococcus qingshengii]
MSAEKKTVATTPTKAADAPTFLKSVVTPSDTRTTMGLGKMCKYKSYGN